MRKLFEGVVSRKGLLNTYKQYDYTAALISLWSPGDYTKFEKKEPEYIKDYIKVKDYFDTSIRQEFWDTEDNVPGYPTISKEQADKILEFILGNKDKTFIVHCDAGQSRSAGVALAIECIVEYDGDRYLAGLSPSYTDDERYAPNRKVFDKIMDAFDRKKPERSQDEK